MDIDLTQGLIKEHIVKLAVPAVIGYFFHTMFNVTDTYFAGLISTNALAALSLSASIFFMVLAVGIGMSEALTSLVGNALGEKDIYKAQNTALNGLVFALFLSLTLAISGIFFVPFLINALGDPSYTQDTLAYINIILYGSLFFIASFFLNALLNATGDTKSFRNILIFTAFVNIALNYAFVKMLNLGISGIAAATIISESITMLYLLIKFKRTKLFSSVSLFKYEYKIIKELIKQGFPPSVNMFMMAFGMYIITYYVAPYGKEAVAGFGIGMRIEQIFLMPVIGLNIAALAIISQNNGAKAYDRIRPTLKLSIIYGWVIGTTGYISFLFFAEEFASLLSSDINVIKEVALYLRVSGLAVYGFVIIFLYIAMLQGVRKPNIITPISIYRQIVAPVILFSLLANFSLNISSLWITLDLIIFSSAIFLYWYGNRELHRLDVISYKVL